MATLLSVRLGRYVLLAPTVVLGRAPSCDVVLPGPRASTRHAEIRAQQCGWEIRDMGSRNGTRMGEHTLVPGMWVPLTVGVTLWFGDADERWEVTDLGPPGPCLFDPASGLRLDPVDGRLGPLSYDIERDAYCTPEDEPVAPGAVVDGLVFHHPVLDRTLDTMPARTELHRSRLEIVANGALTRFDVHLDDGTVRVSFEAYAWAIALYVLALEAHNTDEGWVEVQRLARLCGLDRRVLDVYLSRAREAFLREGVVNGDQVVEVRRGARRLGIRNVGIVHPDRAGPDAALQGGSGPESPLRGRSGSS